MVTTRAPLKQSCPQQQLTGSSPKGLPQTRSRRGLLLPHRRARPHLAAGAGKATPEVASIHRHRWVASVNQMPDVHRQKLVVSGPASLHLVAQCTRRAAAHKLSCPVCARHKLVSPISLLHIKGQTLTAVDIREPPQSLSHTVGWPLTARDARRFPRSQRSGARRRGIGGSRQPSAAG